MWKIFLSVLVKKQNGNDKMWLYKIDFNNKLFETFNWYDYIVKYDYNRSDYKGS